MPGTFSRPQPKYFEVMINPFDRETIQALVRLREATDPFRLATTIEQKLDRIAALARHRNPSLRVTSQMARR
jgi:hypothetical protein